LTLLSTLACASEYCTNEQYEHDRALIEEAESTGTLVRGPKSLRDSILVEEGMWFGMNYPEQIAFMQSFECAMGGAAGKKLLYMDVRSLATGKLLTTWTLGGLEPTEERPDLTNPRRSGVMEGENGVSLTGEARTAFLKSTIDECNKGRISAQTYCSCYANAMADSVSMKELAETTAATEARMIALQPKMTAAAKRCMTN
jgi:hypothetical protein